MRLQDMYFVFRDGECVHQFLGHSEALHYIRRKLSGPKHKENKLHEWSYQRGLRPSSRAVMYSK